jgi:hypothetical protein
MSETTVVTPAPERRWLNVAMTGCALVLLLMLASALVILDKPRFGWIVGRMFLPIISIGAIVGAIIMFAGAWKLPQRTKWQGLLLMAWALIAFTSPAFGYLFLLPWGVLIVLLPFVVAAFVTLRR